MSLRRLPPHAGLEQATRLPWLGRGERALPVLECLSLLLFGSLATCLMVFMDWGLRIPGHAILRAVLPMACGLALVPRRGAGTVMCGGAVLTLVGLNLGGHSGPGFGATTSLLLTGPMMDLALWSARPGLRLYFRFAFAGFAANMIAFIMRGSAKAGGGGGRSLASWLPEAVFTYALCGLLAGLISAVMLFRWKGRNPGDAPPSEAKPC